MLVAPPAGPAYNFVIDLCVLEILLLEALVVEDLLTRGMFQIYISRCMDQHICRRWTDLPPLHSVGGMDITLAHLSSGHRPLSIVQRLLGRGAVHPPRKREQPGRVSVLRLPRCRSQRFAARSGVLGLVDQVAAPVGGLSDRGGPEAVG